MLDDPKVSVLMSVYNGEDYLRESIESILNQTYESFEFIIVNDASTDRSKDIIDSFSEEDDRILIIDNQKNLGLAASLNLGIKIAKGEYIVRMDADDISSPERINRQIEFMETHPSVGICGTWFKLDRNNIVAFSEDHNDILADLIFRNCIAHPTVIFRKSLIEKYKLFYNVAFKKAQDYELWVRASKRTLLANIPEVHLCYRVHINQASINGKSIQDSFAIKVIYDQLAKLVPNLSEEYFSFHIRTFLLNEYNNDSLRKLGEWFQLIESANDKKQLYKAKSLAKCLSYYWLKLGLSPKNLRLKDLIIILMSPYFKWTAFFSIFFREQLFFKLHRYILLIR